MTALEKRLRAECAQLVADYGERGDLLAECRVRVSELEAELKEFQIELQEQVAKRLEVHKRVSTLEALLAECEAIIERWYNSPNANSYAVMVDLLTKLKARAGNRT